MRINVLGVGFDNVTLDEAVEQGMSLVHREGTHYVVTPNPEIVEVCREWSEVAHAVNDADLVLPDGIGIIKGAKILGTPLKERVPGIEFAAGLMRMLARENKSLYLLGAKPGIARTAGKHLAEEYPGLVIAGTHDGYFSRDADIVSEIRQSGADVVFVCMGAPRQELWMSRYGAETGAKLLCGLGGCLDIFAGAKKRAPKLFRNHGLEWFYRLLQEPWRFRRMAKLPVFLQHVRQERARLRRLERRTLRESRRNEPPVRTVRRDRTEQRGIRREQRRRRQIEREIMRERAFRRQLEKDRLRRQRRLQRKNRSRQPVQEQNIPPSGTLPLAENSPQSGTLPAEYNGRSPERSTSRRINREEPMPDNRRNHDDAWDEQEVRRAQERIERRRRRRRRRWIQVPLYFLTVMLLSVLLAEFGWLLFTDLCAFHDGPAATSTVVVAAGDTMKDVANKLYDAGLIRYKFFFRIFASFANAEDKIGAGTYDLNTDMDYRALIVGMRSSTASINSGVVRVTIPEGYSVRDIISLLARNGVATEAELYEAARTAEFDYDFIDNSSQDITRLEGYLFPDTYDFFKPERPASALNRLLSNFERKMDAWEEGLSYAQARGYSLHDIITIASLIEKETDGTDQAKIASVIYHRLEGPGSRGGTYGLLQIDAALLYALPGHTGSITAADLETDSPYNLYRTPGLPPTPIANPGAKAVQAALMPEDTDYYYYALAKDRKHRFFANYSDFTTFLAGPDYIGN